MAFTLQLRCFFHQEVHFIFLTIHLVVFAQLGLERKGNILPFSFSSLECAPEWTAPQSMGVKEYVLVGKGIKQEEKERWGRENPSILEVPVEHNSLPSASGVRSGG